MSTSLSPSIENDSLNSPPMQEPDFLYGLFPENFGARVGDFADTIEF